ncbi:hypothetical protein Pcinc_024536 [Petrolisthes cinctipes]|uniref:Cytochrome c oxidase assembly protein COX20, mitochondrial n=1 Tax=Petrolisthes cinctipes TaxID=88211 RepID=A0AAE1F9P8_PETCI|nr:hypothetical protein Pcinc_024536 [Petrolisthes cinctipes]
MLYNFILHFTTFPVLKCALLTSSPHHISQPHTHIMEEENSEAKLMGRKLSEIPCFRNTFLYSISSGLGAGLVHFLATSNVRRSGHVAMASYGCVTLSYWVYCRYNFSQQKFKMAQLQSALQKQAVYEGTDMENTVFREA